MKMTELPLPTHFFGQILLTGVIGLFMFVAGQAMAEGADTNAAVARVQERFQQAHEQFLAQTNDAEAAWHFARACFDLADVATNSSQRRAEIAEIANQGIAAARHSLALNSNSAPAHYYLGMNYGKLADAKRNLFALRLTKDMEREFLAARAIDEHFDRAGPDRNLGLLYWQAPAIGSIGSRSKARQYLKFAVQTAPDFPENQLNMIEAYLKWGPQADARRQFEEFEKLWPDAQKQFSGEEWAITWADWNKRLALIRKKLGTGTKGER